VRGSVIDWLYSVAFVLHGWFHTKGCEAALVRATTHADAGRPTYFPVFKSGGPSRGGGDVARRHALARLLGWDRCGLVVNVPAGVDHAMGQPFQSVPPHPAR